MIHTGDCIEVMAGMPADSVDAIVTDPPAGIAFMSKHWDRDKGGRTEWVAWMTEVMRECYRVLRPGGYAVVWSLPRTCHWTAWAMEDAGFIIRDQLAHIFASGFPKGKAQLKPAREDWWLARKPGPLRPLNIEENRIGTSKDVPASPAKAHPGFEGKSFAMPERSRDEAGFNPNEGRWPSNVLLSDPELFDEPNPYVVGSGATATSGGIEAVQSRSAAFGGGRHSENGYGDSGGYSRFFIVPKADRRDREPVLRGQLATSDENFMAGLPDPRMDHPQARNPRENAHPTVKPTDLMRHLVRLVTPIGGTVLDCFAGSGSTLIAAEMEGFAWIGIEKEPEYVAIAEARLNGVQRGLGLDVGAPTSSYRPPAKMPPIRHDQSTQGHWESYTGRPDEEPAA